MYFAIFSELILLLYAVNSECQGVFCDFFRKSVDMKERIKNLCDSKGISMNKLEEILGFGKGYISKLGTTTPNTTKIKLIADYFGVSVDYIITGEDSNPDTPYYINDDAREMAQFMFENPEYKVLFDASRKVSKDDINVVKSLLDKFRSED